jgi:citrate lyase beta subunit
MARASEAARVRSWLFCPASRPERLEKAVATGADAVIADLEDGVAPADKDAARGHAVAWLTADRTAGVIRCVRVNPLATEAGRRDVAALADSGAAPDYVIVPKAERLEELEPLAAPILPLIETARGLSAAEALAAHPRVAGLVLGGADLAADLGAEMSWEPLLYARSRLVHAAATAGVAVVDVPCLTLDDAAAVADETARVRRLGFTGKLAVHPSQVVPINAAFTPTAAELDRARRIVAAVAAAGGGVAVVDGKMVDAPVVRSAERALALAMRR